MCFGGCSQNCRQDRHYCTPCSPDRPPQEPGHPYSSQGPGAVRAAIAMTGLSCCNVTVSGIRLLEEKRPCSAAVQGARPEHGTMNRSVAVLGSMMASISTIRAGSRLKSHVAHTQGVYSALHLHPLSTNGGSQTTLAGSECWREWGPSWSTCHWFPNSKQRHGQTLFNGDPSLAMLPSRRPFRVARPPTDAWRIAKAHC